MDGDAVEAVLGAAGPSGRPPAGGPGRAHGPGGRRAPARVPGPVEQGDRRPAGHLAQDGPQPHRAHLREDRRLEPGGRQPLRRPARPAPRPGACRSCRSPKMGQSPHEPCDRLHLYRGRTSTRADETRPTWVSGASSSPPPTTARSRESSEAGLTDMRRSPAGPGVRTGAGGRRRHRAPTWPTTGRPSTSLTITEPEVPMLKRLERRVRAEAPETTVLRAPAEDLPFEDDTFDVVVSTLVLCGVDDQPRAVREIRRVLRPEGRLLFLEHVRSTDPKVAKKQDRLNWLNQLVVCCDCNRPTLDTIRDAGFERHHARAHRPCPKAPSFVRPAIVGTATSPAGTTARTPQLGDRPFFATGSTDPKGACHAQGIQADRRTGRRLRCRRGPTRRARRLHRELRLHPPGPRPGPDAQGPPGRQMPSARTGGTSSRVDSPSATATTRRSSRPATPSTCHRAMPPKPRKEPRSSSSAPPRSWRRWRRDEEGDAVAPDQLLSLDLSTDKEPS